MENKGRSPLNPDGELNMGYDESFDGDYNPEFNRDFDQYRDNPGERKSGSSREEIYQGEEPAQMQGIHQPEDVYQTRKLYVPEEIYGSEESSLTQQTYQSEGAYRNEEPYQSESVYQSEGTYQSGGAYQSEGTYQSESAYQSEGTYQSGESYQNEQPYESEENSWNGEAYRAEETNEVWQPEEKKAPILIKPEYDEDTEGSNENGRYEAEDRFYGDYDEGADVMSDRKYPEQIPIGRPAQSGRGNGYRRTGNGSGRTRAVREDGRAPARRRTTESERARRMRQKKARRRKAIMVRLMVLLVPVLIVGLVLYLILTSNRYVRKSIAVEAGSVCPSVEAFLKREAEDAEIVSGIEPGMVLDHVKEYSVVIRVKKKEYTSTMYVRDTVAPQAVTKDLTKLVDETVAPEDFITSITDGTDCKVEYAKAIQTSAVGEYPVQLKLTDEGGNTAEVTAHLTLISDVTAPVIEGVEEITVKVGEGVSYKKNITVTDDQDENVKLEVDNSAVNTDQAGDYPITYIATDSAGNRTEVPTVLHVREPIKVKGSNFTEDDVNAKADEILAQITDSSMTQKEILRAIYDWCHDKIAFINDSPKDNWVEGAYSGLVNRKGDCFAYAMSAKCLLDRAGIKNMDIERIRYANGMHFWNLVDIGEGWHHFDTCRRADGSTFFYLTDAELMEYSNKHKHKPDYPNGTHYYDRSLYPEIP